MQINLSELYITIYTAPWCIFCKPFIISAINTFRNYGISVKQISIVTIETQQDKLYLQEQRGIIGVPTITFSFPKRFAVGWELYTSKKCLDNIGAELPNSRILGVLNKLDLLKEIRRLICSMHDL